MLETFFPASKMPNHLRSGPSGPYLDSFAAALERLGYSADIAVRYLRAAAHLGHVLARRGALPSEIDLQAFSEHLRTCRCPRAKGGRHNHHTIYGAGSFTGTSSRSACAGPLRWQRRPSSRHWSSASKHGCASTAGRPIPPSGSTLVTLPD